MNIGYYGDPSDLIDLIEIKECEIKEIKKIFVVENRAGLEGFIKIGIDFFLFKRIVFLLKCFWETYKDKSEKLVIYQTRFVSVISLLSWVFKLFCGRKVNISLFLVTGSIDRKYEKLKNFLWKIDMLFVDRIFFISEGLKNKFFPKNNSNKISVLPPGLSKKKFISNQVQQSICNQLGLNSETFVFIYVGTLNNRALDYFFENIIYDINDFNILIVGEGIDEEKRKLINVFKKKNILSKVKFLGFKPYSSLPLFLSISHVGLSFVPQITIYEHQPPYKLFQYLSYGLPSIVTRTAYIKSLGKEFFDVVIEFKEGLKLSEVQRKFGEMKSKIQEKSRKNFPYWEESIFKLLEKS